jgi:hypothetical protein
MFPVSLSPMCPVRTKHKWEVLAQAAVRVIPSLWAALPLDWLENSHGEIKHEMTLENVLFLLDHFTRDPSVFWSSLLSS